MRKLVNGQYVDMTDAEIAEYQASLPTQEELIQNTIKEAEQSIQTYINTVVKGLGYDDENSIAKYLVNGNPFYDECQAISLWIGSVWVYAHQVQADVLAGTREMPTKEELIAELPALEV